MAVIEIKNLTFFYPQSEKSTLNSLSLTVNEGDFLVLCGPSGCGKTTLLRQLKPQISPNGERTGEILFNNKKLSDCSQVDLIREIGFVGQSPENQIVTDKVWHELSFGLESLGLDSEIIRARVAEMAAFFGIEKWFYKDVSELSGGQKQILNLASVMVMQPKLLVLDEPTSQLDPIGAAEFLDTIKKINRELGTTVIISEQRLEQAIPLSTMVAFMSEGSILSCGSASFVANILKEKNSSMFLAMPSSMRIWASVNSSEKTPVSVNEGRNFLKSYIKNIEPKPLKSVEIKNNNQVVLEGKDLWFRYEKNSDDIIKGTDISLKKGEFYCLLGGNGAGKTTLLKVLSGCEKNYRGKVVNTGEISLLSQNPETMFLKKTVYEDFYLALNKFELTEEEKTLKIKNVIDLCYLNGLENMHPYDLSGGEKQRAALGKLLLGEPKILLLDEPTKGMDVTFKIQFAEILKGLLKNGVSILMVSHDVEFCAKYAHKCGMFFDGKIITENEPKEFFTNNNFYTTSASRISRNIIKNAVTTEDIIYAIGGNEFKPPKTKIKAYLPKTQKSPVENKEKLPLWRKICAGITGLISLVIFIYVTIKGTLFESLENGEFNYLGEKQLVVYSLLIIFLIITALLITKKSKRNLEKAQKQKLSKRNVVAIFISVLLIPITLLLGMKLLDVKQYYVTLILVLIECMLPFFMVFEGKKPKSEEIVTIAVMCALAVAGRAVFYMVPQFKPVLAITILSGVALGSESGFLVGAVSMLCSNILFSQGPWTPFQMFAAGIIGFLAGLLYKKGLLNPNRISLCIFGALATIVIYGGIMNPSTALIWGAESLNLKVILSYYLTGFPMDLIHAFSTAIFLWFLSEPMLEKLERIKIKYGFLV